MRINLLVVDDEQASHDLLRIALAAWPRGEIKLVHTLNPEQALTALGRESFHVALVDLHYAGEARGYDLLGRLREMDPQIELIVVSSSGEFDSAQSAMRAGASDFVLKGYGRPELFHSLERALERRRWKRLETRLRDRDPPGFAIVGSSPPLEKMKAELKKIAPKDIAVLLEGETGSGKEVAARALHLWGQDPASAFVAVNCAAVPATTADSFFFGHERGAFTGADRAREGVFESVDGGTLFLDEINSLSLDLQGRLLRVLQEKEVKRLGGNVNRPVEFRLVAAANRSLGEMAKKGEFREDLFYRISALSLRVPTLRERTSDLPALQNFFLPERTLSPELQRVLAEHTWPGNVRELRNLLQAMDALADPGETLGLEHLPENSLRGMAPKGEEGPEQASNLSFARAQEEREREFLARAYRSCAGNVSRVARLLGVDRSHLHQKLVKFEIHRAKN